MFILLFKTDLFKMSLNAAERESFRKHLEISFVINPNIKNSEIVNHFENEGIAQTTIYNNLKRLVAGQSFSDKKRFGCPTSWTREKKAKIKRFVNNQKGFNQRKLGIKLGINQSTIGCQF